jgi:HK97 family phage prohead protease
MKNKTVRQRKMEQLWSTGKAKAHRSIYFKDFAGIMSLKQDEATGGDIATGYLNAFDVKDSQKDIVHRGAFTKSIAERGPESTTPRKIAFLYAHKMDVPIGKFTKLQELTKGLYYEGPLDKIPFVTDTIKPQLKSGTLNNHSIGYNYVFDKGEYDEDKDEFHWYELEVFEGSLLVAGSNPETPFTGFKNFANGLDTVNSWADEANLLLKSIGDYKKEYELRNILQRYQSLLEQAAVEITAMKKKPKRADLKYIASNFRL